MAKVSMMLRLPEELAARLRQEWAKEVAQRRISFNAWVVERLRGFIAGGAEQ